ACQVSERCLLYLQPAAIRMAVYTFELFDAIDVTPRLGETDPATLGDPAIDVVLAGVVRSKRHLLLSVLVQQVAEIPRAVADVDLGFAEAAAPERRPPRATCDAEGGRRQELHQPDRPRTRARVRVELALLVDDRREQGRVEMVVPRMAPDDRVVVQRVP